MTMFHNNAVTNKESSEFCYKLYIENCSEHPDFATFMFVGTAIMMNYNMSGFMKSKSQTKILSQLLEIDYVNVLTDSVSLLFSI